MEQAVLDYNKRVMRVLLYIQSHLDEAMNLEKLAEIANVSPYYFHRLFKGMVGEPVLEHVRRLRLERAAMHLKSTERSISQIAFDAGYETHEAFTRAFKSCFENSPSAFRKKHRCVPNADSPSGIHYNEEGFVGDFRPLTEDYIMEEVKVVEKEKMRVAFVRHIGPYQECGWAWEKLCGWAGPQGLLTEDITYIGVSYDNPHVTDPEHIRYDACIELKKDIEPPEGIDVQELAGGTYATFLHKGSFMKLDQSYAAFAQQWMPTSGYKIKDGPSFEIYLNDPDNTPEDDLRTMINIPLEK